MTTTTDIDVLIIGAGPAGALAAALLHRDGVRVLVAEKARFPRFVIGESLLPHCMDLLQEADLLEAVEQQGFLRKHGAVFHRDGKTCDFDFSAQYTAGWKHTFQVPRADFDKTLADTVEARGVDILYGHSVTEVQFQPSQVTISLDQPDGQSRRVTARFILDCSGYGRVLPRLLDLETPSHLPVRQALFAHATGDRRPVGRDEGKICVYVHPQDAWIWVIPFSNGRTSVGVVARPEFFERFPAENRLQAILTSDPTASQRLSDVELVFEPQVLSGYSCAVKQMVGPRFALVGNATEFLDPIFSSGVTLAFASASRAAKVLSRELRGEAVDWASDYVEYLTQGINTFRTYVAAWYNGTLQDIFFSAGANPAVMQQICSVLAGYVWDTSNPYVQQAERALPLLAHIVQGQQPASLRK